MSQHNHTPLSRVEREEIERDIADGLSYREIGRIIGRDHTVISYEVRVNGNPSRSKVSRVNRPAEYSLDGRHYRGQKQVELIRKRKADYERRKREFMANTASYNAKQAEERAHRRKRESMHKCHPPKLSLPQNQYLLSIVIQLLKLRWSPEQISIRLDLLNTLLTCIGSPPLLPTISHTAIYDYIHWKQDKSLVKCLRRRGKPYRHEKRVQYNQTNRTKHSIHDRPDIIDQRGRLGDIEGDTIVGKDTKDRILTHTERISGLIALELVLGFHAMKITEATLKSLKRVYDSYVFSVTYDNGIEFSAWLRTEEGIKALRKANLPADILANISAEESIIYFADPYTPSQRGCNENANGLVRDFLPKGTDFKKLKKRDILKIESLLNNRPRKRLAGFTPLEVWQLVKLTG